MISRRFGATPRRQPSAKQGIFEDLEIPLDHLGADAAVARDVGAVQELGVGQRGRAQELGEGGQVSHRTFGGDLFLQVVGDVGPQVPFGLGREEVRRQKAARHRGLEIEPVDLARAQRPQLVAHGASGQQVGMATTELARARSSEDELPFPVLDQPVHFVEQSWDFLYLVDHRDPAVPSLAQQGRPHRELCEHVRLQQIDEVDRPRVEMLAQPVRLSDLARTPEESGAALPELQVQEARTNLPHVAILSG